MKTIVVTTDFSEASVNAAFYATQLARDLDAKIILMHANMPQESFNQAPVIQKVENAMTDSEFQLNNIKNQMHLHAGGEVEIVELLITGGFFMELYRVCEEANAYAVVMGSQGSTATERFLMGSNSVHAMRNLKWPLITVPPGASYSTIKNIGLASDFDQPVADLPLGRVKQFIEDFHASLHIINVGKKKEFTPDMIFESTVMHDQLMEKSPKYHFIQNENTEEGIMNCAEENHIDLLMVFPRQHGFLDSLFHKSMSKQLVLHSKIPVIALQPTS